ncbi:MAG: exopolyphosphatase [Epsilonproteobacteria bacterium]|nr:exopolyphosphatase [Campylobacterota bacterium]OIO14995.1 MAG: exopolyphosphatase [Helicobacteraceae bacterium CG1_02_36_14]PIP10547.1 MAG: exopolyphosphatase [Sulfurimonas sp. CG23_combo_of_CG06-09_8_20_14_all_36_33]PIS26997.1 MAG: exopolyphosphatase [Sulfurimonas sp. CG08_land_8_20_14_0_20_36_33]PIU35891.1 MAG: exopolyphosphatase [Sulfurimonas sp. CG07_land_8_20_14_0_80_36_56]PIV03468.1 MAG: exopolyphosphatase [Sulfurimonas sp. CG03_land_8_20_14_0_80_36_25]PIV35414.1 MAG: exopolyphosphat
MAGKFRLVTRSDMDGLVCAVILKQLDMIDEITFVHPKDMQDGIIEITSNDIITNLPYSENAHIVFDHHESEAMRNGKADNYFIDPKAPSAARIVYEYYGGAEKLPAVSPDMMLAVDKADAAQFSIEDILNPKGWELLSFLMDSRTGLGRFREFTVSNYQLMMNLIDYCINHTIDEIMQLPDVVERVELFNKYAEDFKEQLQRCSKVYDNLIVLDLRDEEIIYPGNRFMIYALNPETNISIHVLWGFKNQNTVFATGKSIVNRTSKTNIGELMLKNGGGGHSAAGTCQIDNDKAEDILKELIEAITNDG